MLTQPEHLVHAPSFNLVPDAYLPIVSLHVLFWVFRVLLLKTLPESSKNGNGVNINR